MKQAAFKALVQPVTPPTLTDGDLRTWLVQYAQHYAIHWLLAHFDDGVNWGLVQDGKLVVSHDCFPDHAPALRVETLQQARLFGEAGELLLWQTNGAWHSRFLPNGNPEQTLTDHYLLWGDRTQESVNGFMLLAEGAEGLHHAPPLPPNGTFNPATERMALRIQHYVAYDDDGQAYIAASRLVGLDVIAKKEEN